MLHSFEQFVGGVSIQIAQHGDSFCTGKAIGHIKDFCEDFVLVGGKAARVRDLYRNTTNELLERMEHLRTSVGALADSLGQSVLEKIAA